MKTLQTNIYLPDVVGGGYGTFWRSRKRYRVVKGSRGSKKSKTAALWLVYNIMKYPGSNAVVFRKTFRTLKDSCYADLQWAVHRLGVDRWWTSTTNPLEMRYQAGNGKPQKILFRGLDDPLKITSLTVEHGSLCWAWLEEAYELMNEDTFNLLDESIRGAVDEPLFKGWIITLNPWNERHWIKRRFFDSENDDVLALTTTYKQNEWLDDADRRLFDEMQKSNPARYKVAGLGEWGTVEGLVFENWKEQAFDLADLPKDCRTVCGLDFGYTQDPTAFFIGFLDEKNKRLYVWDELYEKGLSNKAIYDRICNAGYAKERITADSAEPKSIDELRAMGLRVKGAKKGPDSIMYGVQWLQDLEIIIHSRCNNFLTEINNYAWEEDKFGAKLNRPIDDFNHLMDAMRYAVEPYIRKGKWQF